MLSITHVATGSLLAHYFPSPTIFLPITLASHYILDWIPHWDCGSGLEDGTKSKKQALFQEVFDLIASVGFVYYVFQYGQNEFQTHIWLAAFVSLIPDFIEAPANFLDFNPYIIKPLNNFHAKFHTITLPVIEGLTPQLVALFLIYLLS
jgi:hypothetical protein